MRRILAMVAVLSALGPPLLAQRTTGGFSGTAKDSTGAVLPGVTVSITGPTVVGAQTATTNEHRKRRPEGGRPATVFSIQATASAVVRSPFLCSVLRNWAPAEPPSNASS